MSMTEPIQADPAASKHRKGDFRCAALVALGLWLGAFGIDRLGPILFHRRESSILPMLVMTQFLVFFGPIFMHGKVVDRATKRHGVVALFLVLTTWIFILVLEPTRSLTGFLVCIPMMVTVAYAILPVYRRGQEVEKRLRVEARERKKDRNSHSN